MMDRMVAAANADALLASNAKFVDLTFELAVGNDCWVVRLDHGKVSATPRDASDAKVAFTIRAGSDAWADFCQPVPPPGTHDILALFEGERLTLEGDMLQLFRNLMLVKRVLAKARLAGGVQ